MPSAVEENLFKYEEKYKQIQNTYKDRNRFVMSKVNFVDDAKAAYVSCPVKLVVDLSKTTMDPGVVTTGSAVQPTPTATVASSIDLATNQVFDVTALVQEVHETRQHENNRSYFVVTIYDGSLDNDAQKVKGHATDSLFRYGAEEERQFKSCQ